MSWTGKTNFKTGESIVIDEAAGKIIANVYPAESMDATARRAHTVAASEDLRDSLRELLECTDLPQPGANFLQELQARTTRFTAAREKAQQALAAAERSTP